MPNLVAVLTEASQLTVDDRLELIEALWDTLDPSQLPPISEEWAVEIRRRSSEIDRGSAKPIPWHEIRDAALARLKKKTAHDSN